MEIIKKLVLSTILILSSFLVKAQSDLIIDSVATAKTLQVYEFDATPSQLFCPTYGLIHSGHNITITSSLVLANMGIQTAHLGVANVTPGVIWDTCRGYNYYYDFCEFELRDKCGNLLAVSDKALYDVASGQHYLQVNDPDFQIRWNWITKYGIPDLNYLNNTIDSGFSTDEAPILYAGYRDTYGPAQFGNWLNIESSIPNMIIGDIYTFSISIDPFFLNEGSNIYPNKVTVPFIWNGYVGTGYSLSVIDTLVNCCAGSLSIPQSCVANGTQLSWLPVSNACGYIIQRWLVKGNNQIQASGPLKRTNLLQYNDTDNIPKGQYIWYIKAENTTGFGQEGHTNRINIK